MIPFRCRATRPGVLEYSQCPTHSYFFCFSLGLNQESLQKLTDPKHPQIWKRCAGCDELLAVSSEIPKAEADNPPAFVFQLASALSIKPHLLRVVWSVDLGPELDVRPREVKAGETAVSTG